MKKFNFQTFMVFFILSATVALAYQIPYLRYTFYDQFAAAYQFSNTQIGLDLYKHNLLPDWRLCRG